ncbi:hypothetical protein AOT82_2711 [Psychrobacter sp. AntiMn-1]|nr:hypothetical protein AOT82_2711 [Psychrobacter sp. AntiMn-1]
MVQKSKAFWLLFTRFPYTINYVYYNFTLLLESRLGIGKIYLVAYKE